ncbi:MAG: hypothetical protein M1434_14950 [Chloroflexi bacterium]|nr:hypothetical protein [Chloroflexota bacterium]MCL5276018.1 hypothetical protein [Chloroflexota bacterium]
MAATLKSPAGTPTPTVQRIAKIWWPLAASWLLMAVELPVISAIMARLSNPEISLAAYGGIVLPLALLIESPIIMLLAASTTLSKDWDSYQKIRRYMMSAGLALTLLHILIAFTPLYYVVVRGMLGAPPEIVEPGRLGLMLMLPWSWSIAYRRFHQGVLIRFGHSRDVGIGTVVRLSAEVIVLTVGTLIGTLPGIAVGAAAVASGVFCEAAFIGWRVRPVLHHELELTPPSEHPLTMRSFIAFYAPLVMTSLLSLLIEPLGSAALSRMPNALESLAVWPVIHGLIFMLQSAGIALNEVVVTFLDEPGSVRPLRRFTTIIIAVTTGLLLVMAATPLSMLWFSQVAALPPALADLARAGLWMALPMPAMSALQSWFQGAILHSRRTRGITESVLVYMLAVGGLLLGGVALAQFTGLYVGLLAFASGIVLQTVWLFVRSRPAMRTMRQRDAGAAVSPVAVTS